MPLEEAARYAKTAIESGTTLPTSRTAQAGETLYKVMPRGIDPSETTGFWMTASQVDAVSKLSLEQAASRLGLPADQLRLAKAAGGFDYFAMNLKPGHTATVFEAKIAPTQQRMFNQGGGATQTYVPNRSLWAEPVKIEVQPGQAVLPPKRGG